MARKAFLINNLEEEHQTNAVCISKNSMENSSNLIHNRLVPQQDDENKKTHEFSQAKTMRNHIKPVNRDQKVHKCDACTKTFSQSGNLKIHIDTVHNGQKDHKCEFCGKLFFLSGNLTKYTNAVHNGQKIKQQ